MVDRHAESGFTLVELLVVIVIIAVLFALSTVNLGQARISTSLTSTTNILLADIKNQQLLAMIGEQGSTASQQPHGLYFQNNDYVLFADSSYNGSDTNNYTVQTNAIDIATTFPSNEVIFDEGDGAVSGFSSGNNTITLSSNGDNQTITINRFGATSVN